MSEEFNVFFDGKGRSIPFTNHDGDDASIGKIKPGTYQLTLDRDETIRVISGRASIDGLLNFEEGDTLHFAKGKTVELVVTKRPKDRGEGDFVYVCVFHD